MGIERLEGLLKMVIGLDLRKPSKRTEMRYLPLVDGL
jgi:hypothetical protein